MEHKILTVLALAFLLGDPTNGRVKDPDEDRAYEFGFTIEGMQHRHEKKDVNGIIQGEFGFITADGVYHVTVYATDENGNFRILSMKNIKVSPPLDGSPDYGSSKYSSFPNKAQTQPPQSISTKASLQPVQVQKKTDISTTRAPNKPFTTQPTLKPACAGCGYVTTSKKPPFASVPAFNQPQGPQGQQFPPGYLQNIPQKGNGIIQGQSFSSGDPQKFPQREGFSSVEIPSTGTSMGDVKSQEIITKASPDSPNLVSRNVQPPTYNQNQLNGIPSKENSNGGSPGIVSSYSDSFSNPPNEQNEVLGLAKPIQHSSQITYRNPESPVKVSNGLIKIPGNPDIAIKDKYPGMVDGLPPGIKEKDISDILYRFNWTVGFQGHYETGYKNGAKVGGYFVNGSDGISRVVTYVADEFGYRPKVKIINIGLSSPDTPKDDKTFELKSFEFVWYPVQ